MEAHNSPSNAGMPSRPSTRRLWIGASLAIRPWPCSLALLDEHLSPLPIMGGAGNAITPSAPSGGQPGRNTQMLPVLQSEEPHLESGGRQRRFLLYTETVEYGHKPQSNLALAEACHPPVCASSGVSARLLGLPSEVIERIGNYLGAAWNTFERKQLAALARSNRVSRNK